MPTPVNLPPQITEDDINPMGSHQPRLTYRTLDSDERIVTVAGQTYTTGVNSTTPTEAVEKEIKVKEKMMDSGIKVLTNVLNEKLTASKPTAEPEEAQPVVLKKKIMTREERIDLLIKLLHEAKKANLADHHKIEELLDELHSYQNLEYTHISHSEARTHRKNSREDNDNLQKAHKDKSVLVTSILSGILSILGGLVGMSQGSLLGVSSTTMQKVSQGLISGGQGTQSFLQLSMNGLNAKVAAQQYLLDESKRASSTFSDAQQQARQMQDRHAEYVRSREAARHEAFKSQTVR